MAAERKLIGLFGMFGTGNIGNDGSLEAMMRFLQRVAPDERLLCICGNPAAVEQAFGLEAVPIYQRPRRPAAGRALAQLQKAAGRATVWLHAFRQLRRLKVLIVPGMGVLDDFSVSPLGLGWPQDILCWWLLGRLMGVKVVLASVGAGPIRHPVSRWLMKAAARSAHYRSYRDRVSKDFMASIGLDVRHDPIHPDIAFRLPAPAATRGHGGQGQPLTIAVGVMAYFGWRNDRERGTAIYAAYLAKMAGYVVWLLDRGHRVRVLMGDQADRRAVDDLLGAVRAQRAECAAAALRFTPARTLHDVMQQLADTDLVVATRYHNVVCALRMGKPTISIGYAEKNDDLLAAMGLAGYCQDIERLDVLRLESQTLRLIAQRAALAQRVREAGLRFDSSLRQQEEALASLIRGAAGSVQPAGLARDPAT